MSRTLVDVDDDALAEAGKALGTATKKDTINEALRQVAGATRERRREAREEFQRMADEGGLDFDRLDEIDS